MGHHIQLSLIIVIELYMNTMILQNTHFLFQLIIPTHSFFPRLFFQLSLKSRTMDVHPCVQLAFDEILNH